jgi:hypothetical protein
LFTSSSPTKELEASNRSKLLTKSTTPQEAKAQLLLKNNQQ